MYLRFKKVHGLLPTSEYELVEGNQAVGFIQIRHKPSYGEGVPAHLANHIYYEIRTEYRGKGYGKIILKLGLEEAKKIGLSEVFITSLESNIASRKIIEGNGGILIDEDIIPADGQKMLKYKIIIPFPRGDTSVIFGVL